MMNGSGSVVGGSGGGDGGNAEIEAQLMGLESVVEELAYPQITPERKELIERELQNFKDQPHAWYLASAFMSMSTNSMVLFYSATVLEHTVHNTWSQLGADERDQVKAFLVDFLESNFTDLKHFVRNKALQVFIAIGQAEWRDYFPRFLDIIKEWCMRPDTLALGLTAVKMLSEECSLSPATRLSDSVLHRMPEFLDIVLSVLKAILHEARTFGDIGVLSGKKAGQSSPVHAPRSSPADDMLGSALQPQSGSGNLHFNTRNLEHTVIALEAIGHFFSWCPLSKLLTEEVVMVLRDFTFIHQPDSRIGCKALRCFNEIHAQRFIPPSFGGYIQLVFELTLQLLNEALQGMETNASFNQSLDEQYLDALVEYLRLFVINYLPRLAADPNISLASAVFNIMRLADQLPAHLFLEAMDVLNELIDLLLEDASNTLAGLRESCREVLVQIAERITDKMQLTKTEMMTELDYRQEKDAEPSEYDQCIDKCAHFVSGATRLYQQDVLSILGKQFMDKLGVIFTGCSKTTTTPEGPRIEFAVEEDMVYFHYACRDLSAMCKMLAMVADVFAAQFENYAAMGKEMLDMSLNVLFSILSAGLHNAHDFIADPLCVQLLVSVEALCPWLRECTKAAIAGTGINIEVLNGIVSQILSAIGQTMETAVAPTLRTAACSLFAVLTSTIKTPIVRQADEYAPLVSMLLENMAPLDSETQILIVSGVSSALVVQWDGASAQEQLWDERTSQLKELVTYASGPLQESLAGGAAPGNFVQACSIMTGICRSFRSERTPAMKQSLPEVQKAIEAAMENLLSFTALDKEESLEAARGFVGLVKEMITAVGSSLPPRWVQQLISNMSFRSLSCCTSRPLLEELLAEFLDCIAHSIRFYEDRLGETLHHITQLISTLAPAILSMSISLQRSFADTVAALLTTRAIRKLEEHIPDLAKSLAACGCTGDLVLLDTMLDAVELLVRQQSEVLLPEVVPFFVESLTKMQDQQTRAQRITAALSQLT
ncbi:hypothetical protein PTSG_12057 [Salpingoeca rosetta]|uniref:Importin N-terminal domain-containing protein n=1 Tax=Salpingoeca rosetta (strain ATCC 50818 / BSB-021) TaxID=946362 RepID=F2U690_SALR5|nr:uncharacterized protein PTSG_12057 [Salpingoeca rosetta]EGD83031.1 hypothetical protein PTSG_12057 [Salpingoeca rosetta]|eukprot:XP_004995395.1 hypothetical protein PTSG_12057 [Salpingoeca rosetta]